MNAAKIHKNVIYIIMYYIFLRKKIFEKNFSLPLLLLLPTSVAEVGGRQQKCF